MGGTWQALIKGFAGLRVKRDILTLDPKLPKQISMIKFSVKFRDCDIEAVVYKDKIRLFLKSLFKNKIKIMIYRSVKELAANKATTFFRKKGGRSV